MSNELIEAMERYRKHFNEVYINYIGIRKTDEEIIEEINQCIKTDTPQAEPDYDDDKIY